MLRSNLILQLCRHRENRRKDLTALSSKLPFQFKVCGITRPEDITSAAESGVEAIGLNFVPRRSRSLSQSSARELVELIRVHSMLFVAVVMDAEADDLRSIVQNLQPDFVQLHGSERPNDVPPEVSGAAQIIKAVSWSGRDEEESLALAWADDPRMKAYLVDAYAPVEGGGTGRRAAWHLLQSVPPSLASHPLILAGGLNSMTVTEGIAATCAVAVDTASGVEISPGVKSPQKMRDFVVAARKAFLAR